MTAEKLMDTCESMEAVKKALSEIKEYALTAEMDDACRRKVITFLSKDIIGCDLLMNCAERKHLCEKLEEIRRQEEDE